MFTSIVLGVFNKLQKTKKMTGQLLVRFSTFRKLYRVVLSMSELYSVLCFRYALEKDNSLLPKILPNPSFVEREREKEKKDIKRKCIRKLQIRKESASYHNT